MGVKPIPDGYSSVTPYLIVSGAAQALDYYKMAFDAQEIMRMPSPDGKIMHAEVKIGDSLIMLNDTMGGGKGPRAFGGSPASLWVYVEDCDSLFNRAVAAGAKVHPGPMGRMADQFWGDRCGAFTDPEGYTWTIATRKEDISPEEMKKRQEEWMKQFSQQQNRG